MNVDYDIIYWTIIAVGMTPALHAVAIILWAMYGPISKKDQDDFDAEMDELFKKHMNR